MNFFEHQQQAKSKTNQLIGLFVLAVIAIVVTVNLALFYGACFSNVYCQSFTDYVTQPLSWFVTIGVIAVIAITSLIRWAQLSKNGGLKAVTMVGARKLDLSSNNPNERQLINLVEEMSIASGLPMPQIYVMDSENAINAFVAGTEPHNAYLAVTKGALERLNRQELQGVIGHEFSHIFNGDMKINLSLIGVLAGILVIGQLGEFLTRSQRYSRKSDKGSQLAFVGLALMLVGYIGLFFGRMIKAAISRQREFLADASAVQYTRDKGGIANALYKIGHTGLGSKLNTLRAEEVSHMCFEQSHKITLFSSMLATHPPIDKRIDKIDPQFVAPSLNSHEERSKSNSEQSQQRVHSQEQTSSFTGEEVLVAGLASHIGTLTDAHMEKTHWKISMLPDALKQIARNQHKQFKPYQLLYSVLFIHNTATRQELLEKLSSRLNEADLNAVIEITPSLGKASIEQQFLLLDLALPRLKQYSEQERKIILATTKAIADCDKKVSLKEYVIFALALKSLDEKQTKGSVVKSYPSITNELLMVLSTFINESNTSEEKKATLLKQSLNSFSISTANIEKPSSIEFQANQFHSALRKLALLNPLLKQPVIDTIVDIIASDGRLSSEEFVLIRAVCEYLDCPMPDLI